MARALALGLIAVGPAASPAVAQILPSDLRPFVRLDFELTTRRYQNPVVRDGKVVDLGVMVEGPTKGTFRNGSGTVISKDGLIVTNFHVYSTLLDAEDRKLTEDGRTLVRTVRTSREMLVAEIDPKSPMEPPKVQYRAKLVAAHPERDIALLKISALASGAPLSGAPRLATAVLGNPYAIPLGGELRILGYPGKGGESVTPSRTEFAGYTRGVDYALDGSFKTVSTIAGGNSGGAALYGERLVGIPTRVSDKREKGSDFGYIHPVTWAAWPLAVAAIRDGQEIPRIERDWVQSPHNTDLTRIRVLVGGRVQSQMTTQPVKKPRVVLYRPDRTLEQIDALQAELGGVMARLKAREMIDAGMPAELVALLLRLPLQTVQDLAKGDAAAPALSADAKKMLEGEFYAASAEAGEDGFFILPAPLRSTVKLSVRAEGFRPVAQDRKIGDAVHEHLGVIALTPEVMRPEPPRR
jgi:S1-C subfamily serine protease